MLVLKASLGNAITTRFPLLSTDMVRAWGEQKALEQTVSYPSVHMRVSGNTGASEILSPLSLFCNENP